MVELLITRFPGRKGVFLGKQDGSRIRKLARFESEEAAQEFIDWAVAAGAVYRAPEGGESGQGSRAV